MLEKLLWETAYPKHLGQRKLRLCMCLSTQNGLEALEARQCKKLPIKAKQKLKDV